MPEDSAPNENQQPANEQPLQPEQPNSVSAQQPQPAPINQSQPVSSEPATPAVTALAASQPTPNTGAAEPQPWLQQPEKKPRKKGVIIGAIIAALLVVLLGSAYGVYALWFQSPEKVLMDGVMNAVSAKSAKISGDASLSYEGYNVTVDFEGEGSVQDGSTGSATLKLKAPEQNIDMKLSGSGVAAPNGDIYIKVDNLKGVYETSLDAIVNAQVEEATKQGYTISNQQKAQVRQTYDSYYGSIIKKIGDKWIKITPDDTKSLDEKAGDEYKCTQDVLKKFTNDKNQIQEVANVYSKNKFIVIKETLGVKDNSLGYVIDYDKEASKKFGSAIKDTTVYKELKKCSESATSYFDDMGKDSTGVDSDASSKTTHRIEVWVDQWSHQFTKIDASVEDHGDQKGKFDITATPQFNTPVKVTIPTNVISIKDLMGEFESLMGSSMSEDEMPTNRT